MKKMDYFGFFLVLLVGIVGCWLGGFLGGVLFGFALSILLLMTLGKWLADKAIRRVNKNIQDSILYPKNY